jgi:hypothetical protein
VKLSINIKILMIPTVVTVNVNVLSAKETVLSPVNNVKSTAKNGTAMSAVLLRPKVLLNVPTTFVIINVTITTNLMISVLKISLTLQTAVNQVYVTVVSLVSNGLLKLVMPPKDFTLQMLKLSLTTSVLVLAKILVISITVNGRRLLLLKVAAARLFAIVNVILESVMMISITTSIVTVMNPKNGIPSPSMVTLARRNLASVTSPSVLPNQIQSPIAQLNHARNQELLKMLQLLAVAARLTHANTMKILQDTAAKMSVLITTSNML